MYLLHLHGREIFQVQLNLWKQFQNYHGKPVKLADPFQQIQLLRRLEKVLLIQLRLCQQIDQEMQRRPKFQVRMLAKRKFLLGHDLKLVL